MTDEEQEIIIKNAVDKTFNLFKDMKISMNAEISALEIVFSICCAATGMSQENFEKFLHHMARDYELYAELQKRDDEKQSKM